MKNMSVCLETNLTTMRYDQLDDERLAILFKALAHPARIKILKHLLKEDRCICGGIVNILPLAQSTVSQHLKVLRQAGLLQGTVEGLSICYCVDKKRLALVREAVAALLNLNGGDENER
jgi:ArsR family transcriptional regulator